MDPITSKIKKNFIKNKGKKVELYKNKAFKTLIILELMLIKERK